MIFSIQEIEHVNKFLTAESFPMLIARVLILRWLVGYPPYPFYLERVGVAEWQSGLHYQSTQTSSNSDASSTWQSYRMAFILLRSVAVWSPDLTW